MYTRVGNHPRANEKVSNHEQGWRSWIHYPCQCNFKNNKTTTILSESPSNRPIIFSVCICSLCHCIAVFNTFTIFEGKCFIVYIYWCEALFYAIVYIVFDVFLFILLEWTILNTLNILLVLHSFLTYLWCYYCTKVS